MKRDIYKYINWRYIPYVCTKKKYSVSTIKRARIAEPGDTILTTQHDAQIFLCSGEK